MIDTGFCDKNEAVKRAMEETERLLPKSIKTYLSSIVQK